MEVWGVTGMMGAGKSTAIAYLKSQGFPTVDADQVSRLVIDRNTELGRQGFSQVYKAFGSTVLDNLGNLDRGALRKRIVVNPHEREVLEGILHPLMMAHIQKLMTEWKSQNKPFAFIEGARLVESGFHNVLAGIIVVSADEGVRVKRIIKRDHMGKDEVQMMLSLQHEGLMRRVAKAEWKNDKTQKNLEATIDAFIEGRKAKAGK